MPGLSQTVLETLRTLSPSDFGFHNALRRPDGTLCFLDFEYFGWDDPVKLVSDFLLHPGMTLSATRAAALSCTAPRRCMVAMPTFRRVSPHALPLYGLRWVLIMLNEFLPELWARRAFSGKGGDWEGAKRAQLRKARDQIGRVTILPRRTFDRMNLAETGVPLDSRSKHLRSLVIDGLSAGRGHVGSSLSLIEIIRVLYDDVLNVRPQEPRVARSRSLHSK